MTLSQRLTRAGLTFIIVGTVAAVLPQQNETANAANGCSTGAGPGRYAISPTTPATNSTNVTDTYSVGTTSTSFKLYFSPDSSSAYAALSSGVGQSNTIQATSGKLKVSGATITAPGSANNTQATTSIAKVDATTAGAGTFTSTYIVNSVTYTAMITISTS